MKRPRRRNVMVLALAGSVGIAPASAVDNIFSDGFEWGPTCGGTALWFPDADGDRWGDRNASGISVGCPTPPGLVPNNQDCNDANALINPNAFEVPGNGLDDDCDGQTDQPPPICDNGLPSNASDARQYASAIDLCRTTTENRRGWGLIRAGLLTLNNSLGIPVTQSRAIRPAFGSGNVPQAGAAMAVFSTGAAAAAGQTNPNFQAFQPGLDTDTQGPPPPDWLAANGGNFPTVPGCPSALTSATAFNPAMLTLRVRVPSNARSFRLASSFLGSDFPEWVCSPYNDYFVVLLDSAFSGVPANPSDKNLAVYTAPAGAYPVGVNLAFLNMGLFTQCENGIIGCASGATATINTCTGPAGLTGTGMDLPGTSEPPGTPAWCDSDRRNTGGGTDWLAIRGNVVPGEVLELRLAVWDTGGGLYDSVVLLDDFRWSVDLVTPGASRN